MEVQRCLSVLALSVYPIPPFMFGVQSRTSRQHQQLYMDDPIIHQRAKIKRAEFFFFLSLFLTVTGLQLSQFRKKNKRISIIYAEIILSVQHKTRSNFQKPTSNERILKSLHELRSNFHICFECTVQKYILDLSSLSEPLDGLFQLFDMIYRPCICPWENKFYEHIFDVAIDKHKAFKHMQVFNCLYIGLHMDDYEGENFSKLPIQLKIFKLGILINIV